MYNYNEFDHDFVRTRVEEFRDQVERRLSGTLTEEEFKPLRLKNGLYLQLHAYMLRVAIPYGTLNSKQMRQLAMIAEKWDKGYGHFTTRQNIQFNWPKLKDVPDILDALADVSMHAIQTSGNCIRNVTADHFAGAARDEIEDARMTAELLRQWSTDHPEFQYLPRKFKIAVTGSPNDRAVTRAHDIGLRTIRDAEGRKGYEVLIGGGLGRTPMIGKVVREFLPKEDLLPYVEAILRVYNLSGRRDNKYKARIKILVHETGIEELKTQIEKEFVSRKSEFPGINPDLLQTIEWDFSPPEYDRLSVDDYVSRIAHDPEFREWVKNNVARHKVPEYGIVTVSLKPVGGTPGDATADQMRVMANLGEKYAHDELRVSHEQNIVLPHV
ncbi:MAG: nitrite/sulfite reductase, partial [Rhodobacteraceae bacterium]|nr:nitrite/sulfite reductase [Paracoccaceae bacterium]